MCRAMGLRDRDRRKRISQREEIIKCEGRNGKVHANVQKYSSGEIKPDRGRGCLEAVF